LEKLIRGDNLESSGTYSRKILKCTYDKYIVRMLTELNKNWILSNGLVNTVLKLKVQKQNKILSLSQYLLLTEYFVP
jgi:hypothetical protein